MGSSWYFRFTLEDTGLLDSAKNPVEMVNNHQEKIEVGKFVAVHLLDCNEVPVIGKVLAVDDEKVNEEVKLHYWKGSFKGKFSPLNFPRRRVPWINDLPKTCVIMSSFSLTADNRLLPSTRVHLENEYAKLKNSD